jgi:hypothetical protein
MGPFYLAGVLDAPLSAGACVKPALVSSGEDEIIVQEWDGLRMNAGISQCLTNF